MYYTSRSQLKTKVAINLEYDRITRILSMEEILQCYRSIDCIAFSSWYRNFATANGDRISQVMFSHDGQTLISGSWDRTIKLWQLESGKQIANAIHGDRINTIALTSDEAILISGSKDRTIKLWRCCLRE